MKGIPLRLETEPNFYNSVSTKSNDSISDGHKAAGKSSFRLNVYSNAGTTEQIQSSAIWQLLHGGS